MMEGVSLLSHECVWLWLDDGQLLWMPGQACGVKKAPVIQVNIYQKHFAKSFDIYLESLAAIIATLCDSGL